MFDFLKEKAVPQLCKAGRAAVPFAFGIQPAPPARRLTRWPSCSRSVSKACSTSSFRTLRPSRFLPRNVDQDAIDKARPGKYPAGIASDVSPQRLQRFFVQEDAGYRIKKEVRDLVVFASQNILVDPPFTKVDILCCRNLLIYLNVQTQKKLLPLMHYALNPGGLLVLGSAESAGGFGHLFLPLDKKWKVFQRIEARARPGIEMPAVVPPRERPATVIEKGDESDMDILYAAQRALLDCYGPPAVVVNSEGDVVYVSGHIGKYLEPPSGKVNQNVFAMARRGCARSLASRSTMPRRERRHSRPGV